MNAGLSRLRRRSTSSTRAASCLRKKNGSHERSALSCARRAKMRKDLRFFRAPYIGRHSHRGLVSIVAGSGFFPLHPAIDTFNTRGSARSSWVKSMRLEACAPGAWRCSPSRSARCRDCDSPLHTPADLRRPEQRRDRRGKGVVVVHRGNPNSSSMVRITLTVV